MSILWQSYRDAVDQAVDMFDKLLNRAQTQARNELDKQLCRQRQTIQVSLTGLDAPWQDHPQRRHLRVGIERTGFSCFVRQRRWEPRAAKAPQKEPRRLSAFVVQSAVSYIDEPEVPLRSPHQ